MEELKKENLVLKIVVYVLCFALGIGVGYYAFGFFNNQDKTDNNETIKEKEPEKKEEEKKETPTVVSTINSIDDYPATSDDSVTSFGEIISYLDEDTLLTDFEDVTKSSKGSTFKYTCEEYTETMIDVINETMANACTEVSVNIDNSLTISEIDNRQPRGCSISQELYKTDNYYIYIETEGCGKTSRIDIYNTKGTLVKQLGTTNGPYAKTVTNWYFKDIDSNQSENTPIAFVNNTLYYILNTGRANSTSSMVNLEMRSVDLSKDSIVEKTIDSFTGYVTEK